MTDMRPASRIQIVLSPYDLSDDYNRHAGVTILSLLKNCSSPVTVHLLYDKKLCAGKETIVNYNKACYQKIADAYGCELFYHHVEFPDWVSKISLIKKGFSAGSLMRLSLASTLIDIDRVIYLDCDIVVLTDITSLWNIPLGEHCIGACWDPGIPFWRKKDSKKLIKEGYDLNNYFNAGVLILDLKRLRDDNFSDVVYTHFKKHLDTPYIDQDMLNWYCNGNYCRLPEKYNLFSPPSPATDCIIHYAGKKPWNIYSGEKDIYYWKYLMETPWCENIEEYNAYVRAAPDINIILKNDFISKYTQGSIFQRLIFANKFILSILRSIVHNALKLVFH